MAARLTHVQLIAEAWVRITLDPIRPASNKQCICFAYELIQLYGYHHSREHQS